MGLVEKFKGVVKKAITPLYNRILDSAYYPDDNSRDDYIHAFEKFSAIIGQSENLTIQEAQQCACARIRRADASPEAIDLTSRVHELMRTYENNGSDHHNMTGSKGCSLDCPN